MQIHFALLDESTNVDEFDCKDENLNLFLKNLALLFQKRHFGVTIIGKDAITAKLIGFYTLCPASIQREVLPDKFLSGPRPNPIPGFRLCRLAVDDSYQGKGFGRVLLVHALKKCLAQSREIGGTVVMIDAKDEKAKKFYEHFGFLTLANGSLVLIQTIKFIERHFEE